MRHIAETAETTETTLDLPHGRLHLPAFLPDGTRGVVRSTGADDLAGCGVQALMMNTFHLMQRPGTSTVRALGGLHAMSGWQRPIFTDSGGFQAYSLIRQDPTRGWLSKKGIRFRPDGTGRGFNLSPEKTVQLQLSYGADVVVCLDDCTHVDDPPDEQRASVERTLDWARRGREAFWRIVEQKGFAAGERPLLFAVIQGGGSLDLRRRCAGELLEIGFDGFGYGGWPLDGEGRLLIDVLATVRESVPREFPLHGLGIGHPENVVRCARMGYGLFDSAMPTRDARHGRLTVFAGDPARSDLAGDWFSYVYVGDKKHVKVAQSLSPWCDCACCARTSLGYLHHLFKIGDGLYHRLATVHNLRFMTQLMARLRTLASQEQSP